MKARFLIYLAMVTLVSCTKKEDPPPVIAVIPVVPPPASDYRDAFTGSYLCIHKYIYFVLGQQSGTSYTDTVYLEVKKCTWPPEHIQVGQDTIRIDSSGNYKGMYSVRWYKNYDLTFKKDSIYLYTFSGGSGGGENNSYAGRR